MDINTAVSKLHYLVIHTLKFNFIAELADHTCHIEGPASNFDRICFGCYCTFLLIYYLIITNLKLTYNINCVEF
jgi:hypothetical protein